MPRSIRSASLETRTARLKLAKRRKPYWITIAPGISLGYRAGPGTWNVRAADGDSGNWIKSFALADDHEDSNGETVLDFWTAQGKARQLARGTDGDTERPATVDEAIDSYRDDLIARGGNPSTRPGYASMFRRPYWRSRSASPPPKTGARSAMRCARPSGARASTAAPRTRKPA